METSRGAPGSVGNEEFNRDNLLTLLDIYTTQFASYTTLLWQVPALGLAAQAFLMTVVLGSMSNGAKYAAAGLSVIIASASIGLMRSQRGRAINQNGLAKMVSQRLKLKPLLGEFSLEDAVPRTINAEDVWSVNHTTYHFWIFCMALFIMLDATVITSIAAGTDWFT